MSGINSINDEIFAASLLCQTKAYLLNAGETGHPDELRCLELDLLDKYRQQAREILKTNIPANEQHEGMPPEALHTKNQYLLILDPYLGCKDIATQPDALLRTTRGTNVAAYGPVRYVRTEKIIDVDRLLLAFDAIVLSRAHRITAVTGRIIHGRQYKTTTVSLSKWLPKARSQLKAVAATLEQPSPTPVLNKHCAACEFRTRCRGIAIDQDDLSLLGNMRPKDRQKLINKGIFTVTQLSYTFRPRRRRKINRPVTLKHDPALKALAIRKRIVHVVGRPEFTVYPTRTVYIDVEGIPDVDFYYLVGIRFNDGHRDVQHSFWADSPEEERALWASCVRVLQSIDNPQIVHYGSYETQYFQRMIDRYGLNDDNLERVLRTSLNLLTLTYAQVYFPTYSNSLKDIAQYLGFEWSQKNASGRQAVYWRLQWEDTRDTSFKQKLLTYNAEDCKALETTASTVANVCAGRSLETEKTFIDVGDLEGDRPLRFGPLQYAVPGFQQINEAAYWDYQRNRVYVRSSERLRSVARLKQRQSVRRPRLNKTIGPELNRPDACPKCSIGKMYRRGIFSHLIYDIRFKVGGARRWVVRHRFYRYECSQCKYGYNASPRRGRAGAGLRAFVVFSVIELRISQHAVGRLMGTLFGLPMSPGAVHWIKNEATRHYEETYKTILRHIVTGRLVHADETQVTVEGHTHYVWVFTNLEQVAYVYSESRDASTVRTVLAGFTGVLVSDFYTAYDSIECAQQRCLVHLLRDINEDVRKNAFNVEMSEFANEFGGLLRPIIETIDQFGLKTSRLRRHRGSVNRFYKMLDQRDYKTEIAIAYKRRFERNRKKLFTFLDHDGVPWNNNNAEHAVKAFARLREVIGPNTTPRGIYEYLVLLSIAETCNYRGISFLEFLRSGHADVEVFDRERTRRRTRAEGARSNEVAGPQQQS